MSTVKTWSYILRAMGRLKISEGLEIRKGFLEEVSLELHNVAKRHMS